MRNFYLAALAFCLTSSVLTAQGFVEKVTDFLEINVGTPPDTSYFQNKVVLAPIAYYEPNTSVGLGIGAKFLFKFRKAQDRTRTSNLPVSVSYTLNSQFFFTSSYTVFFPEEKWLLRGNLNYRDFPLDYYGVGNGTDEDDLMEIAYQQFLFEPLLLRQIVPNFFAGGGIRYNRFYNTVLEDDFGEIPEGTDLQDDLGSTSTGLEAALIYDSRDNVLNARRGLVVEFTQGFYDERYGGTHSFELSKLDVRNYKALTERSTLAVQIYGRHTFSDAPVQELSTLGGESILRGFQEFRFRDRLATFAQAEYRYQGRGRFGFVTFAGAGQVAEGFGDLDLAGFRYSVGAGLRITIIPSERLNLRFDYALGIGPSSDRNFYLGIAEAF